MDLSGDMVISLRPASWKRIPVPVAEKPGFMEWPPAWMANSALRQVRVLSIRAAALWVMGRRIQAGFAAVCAAGEDIFDVSISSHVSLLQWETDTNMCLPH